MNSCGYLTFTKFKNYHAWVIDISIFLYINHNHDKTPLGLAKINLIAWSLIKLGPCKLHASRISLPHFSYVNNFQMSLQFYSLCIQPTLISGSYTEIEGGGGCSTHNCRIANFMYSISVCSIFFCFQMCSINLIYISVMCV